MTNVFSLNRYRQVDEREDLVLNLGHLAIAGSQDQLRQSSQLRSFERELRCRFDFSKVLDPPTTIRQLEEFARLAGDGRPGWQQLLFDVSRPIPSERREALGVELATYSPLLDQSDLGGGAVQRRIDAVLDVLATSYCAGEVHGTYADVFEHLTDEDLTAGRCALAFAGGAANGALTMHGLGFVGDIVNKQAMAAATRRSTPEIVVDELSRLVLQSWCLAEGRGGADEIRLIRQTLVDDANRLAQDLAEAKRRGYSTSQQERRLNAVRRAAGLLDSEEPEGRDRGNGKVIVPDLVGQRLSDAKEMLELLGLQARSKDCLAPNGSPRTIMNQSNWRVSTQSVLPGSALAAGARVDLGVKKFGER